MTAPEQYFVDSTPWVPGSRLPVLVYRGPLSHCQNEDEVKEALEANGGWAKGGAWNAWFKSHYHPNVHECYGIVSSHLSMLDKYRAANKQPWGKRRRKGLVRIVHRPRPTRRCIKRAADYAKDGRRDGDPRRHLSLFIYIQQRLQICGPFPEGISTPKKLSYVPIIDHYILQDQPKWQSVWCDDSSETAQRAKETLHVPLPSIDPLYGPDGHLVKIWADVSKAADGSSLHLPLQSMVAA